MIERVIWACILTICVGPLLIGLGQWWVMRSICREMAKAQKRLDAEDEADKETTRE